MHLIRLRSLHAFCTGMDDLVVAFTIVGEVW